MLFDGKLKYFKKIKFTKFQKECFLGWCIGYVTQKKKVRYSKLILTPQFPSIDIFKTTLIHEMVHHYTWLEHGIIDHGQEFLAWQKKVKKLTTYTLSKLISLD